MAAVAVRASTAPAGIKQYYQAKIEAAELLINQKTQNLRRLEAQRNALNARGMPISLRSSGCNWLNIQ
jgi:26S proteasome regulatory subunit T6